ncbi:TonB-dependent receptor [Sphingobium sufflavum]|uniref:TonB-dependent receptor n=1 Tax=Sphingobium sufflavum TaxID=1129547 RepID=UPI001F22E163|nr:TonB-dependent receptor [Sphingobium sufflavum]MCE7797139.1 TonB-dependent receptor [Sphingobium sufflavum]
MSYRMFVLAGVSLASLAVPAMAQEQAADNEIIVTARRREEDIQDVPLVINAITSAQAQKLNIRDAVDVQTLVPGLQLRNESGGIGGSAQMRGIQYDVNAGAAPTVAFYQNDAPVEASMLLQAMYDIGQIGVERGPQGTLRGVSAPSGAITITTNKPNLYKIEGNVATTANNIGTLNVNGAISVPLVEGILAVRAAGIWEQQEVNRVRTFERDGDWRDPYARTKSGRASLLFTPAEWLRVEGTYQKMWRTSRFFSQYESFSQADPTAPASPRLITAGSRESIQETPTLVDQVFEIYNWRSEARLAGQLLVYQGSRSELTVANRANQDNANFVNGADYYQTTNTNSVQATHEVRLQNEERFFGIFDYVLGYYTQTQLARTNLTTPTPIYLAPPTLGAAPFFVNSTPIAKTQNGNLRQDSVFGNLTVHIGDATEVSGGLRYIKFRDPGGVLNIGGDLRQTPGTRDSGVVYVASAKHNFTPDLMVYAMTGTSRRAGPNVTGDFSLTKSALQESFQFLPSETSRSYEIGFKSAWFDRRLKLNVTAFHQTFKNYPFRSSSGVYYVNYAQPPVGSPAGTPPVQEVKSFNFVSPVPVEVNGIEGELSFSVTPEFNFGVQGSYALGKIKDGNVACTDLNGDGVPDSVTVAPTLAVLQGAVGANNIDACRVTQRSSYQSPFTATVQAEYRRGVSEKVDGFVRGLFSYYGSSQGDPTYAFDNIGAYGLLNLFTGISDAKGKWEVTVFAKNIFEVTKTLTREFPATSGYNIGRTAAIYTSPYNKITSTPPREFGVTTRFNF